MLRIPPLPPFLRRERTMTVTSPPPAALTLLAATYQEAAWVTLTFDRAIEIEAVVPEAVVVDDAHFTTSAWTGGSATLESPTQVRITLVETGPAAGSGTRLSATALTGIVASDDGGTWAGVTDVALPFS